MSHQRFSFVSAAPRNATQLATVTGAEQVAIPTTEGGSAPKYVMLCAYGGTQTNVLYVGLSVGGTGTAHASHSFPLPVVSNSRVILNAVGMTHVEVFEVGDNTSHLQVIPLEDF